MPRSLALRDCQLPQEQIDSVKGESREGERPIQETGSPSKAQIKSRKSSAVDFINTIDPQRTFGLAGTHKNLEILQSLWVCWNFAAISGLQICRNA